jgi:two-component system phosphate regulon response regulator PhoB
MMPNESGWDVAAKLKDNPKWKHIPIVFLTAKGDTMSVGMGGLAAEDYIVKPFDIKDLVLRVKKILEHS